ncbi:Alpha/beta hydrolase family protein [Tsuneonella dongtanensis]|uniref:Alpha/beta hydrolase family protein n=1 Tax=Tsuneonella dongtanensis TaxID=692370 RepID=A0A1B2ADM8_9SPHN|nr:alpha/beta hydrolase [Tsuneonella dongtanensis]ANY20244.1 Alpha/beta hydrolase family protein [Tsuneonella dongtanensis]
MGVGEFQITAIVGGPRAVDLGAAGVAPELSASDCDDLMALLGHGQRYRLLPRSWGNGWPGRGNLFLVAGSSLSDRWAEVCGVDLDHQRPQALVLRFSDAAWDKAIRRVAEGYGLSPIEASLASALAEFGDFEQAAVAAGLATVPARNAVMRLRAKFGTRNLAETVEHVLMIMFGPRADDLKPVDEQVADMLEISLRHLEVARAMAGGTPRKTIARNAKTSLATVKVLLAEVYERIGVASAAEVSCVLAQAVNVVEAFLERPDGALAPAPRPRHAEIVAEDGRRIAYSVFGERGRPAVVLLHSSICCRHPPTRFVRRLNRLGWQVIAADRPGFGGTCVARSSGADAHFAQSADDLGQILDAEDLEDCVLVSRSAGQGSFTFTDRLGDRISRTILFNPTPPISHTPVDKGPLGALKRRYARSPGSIRLLIGLLLRYASPERIVMGMRRSFAQSEADLRALDDPKVAEDYLLAAMPLRDNLAGYITENVEWAEGWEPRPQGRTDRYTLVFGRHFVLHDPQVSRRYFQQVLPGAECHILPTAGQMLLYSHPEEAAGFVGAPAA